MTVTIYCERTNGDTSAGWAVECEFKLRSGSRGKRDRYGVPLEPDEPPSFEFIRATADGESFELTDAEIDRAEELAWDKLADDAGDYPDNDR